MEKVNKRFWGDDEEQTKQETTQTMTPQDYGEATGARQNWWQTLQDWGKSGNYGLVSAPYDDIYSQAAKKINQYYWGGPSSPGMMDKVKASAARRGVSESPAADVLMQRTGVEEANQLKDLSVGVSSAKAEATENARMNWLKSLMSLSGLKSGAYTSTGTATTTQPGTDMWDAIGSIGGAIGTGLGYSFGGPLGGAFMSGLTSLAQTPQKTQGSLTDLSVSPGWAL